VNTFEYLSSDALSELNAVSRELWPQLEDVKPHLEHHATHDRTASNVRHLAPQLSPEIRVEARVQMLSYWAAIRAAEWLNLLLHAGHDLRTGAGADSLSACSVLCNLRFQCPLWPGPHTRGRAVGQGNRHRPSDPSPRCRYDPGRGRRDRGQGVRDTPRSLPT
jgi:hypothetical protein